MERSGKEMRYYTTPNECGIQCGFWAPSDYQMGKRTTAPSVVDMAREVVASISESPQQPQRLRFKADPYMHVALFFEYSPLYNDPKENLVLRAVVEECRALLAALEEQERER